MSADGPRDAGAITELLDAVGRGDSLARERLWNLVYEELRRVAHCQVLVERRGGGLHTTILVHEAYVRLVGDGVPDVDWKNRRHFFAAAAKAMRRIRVDDTRTRARLKRGGPGIRGGSGVSGGMGSGEQGDGGPSAVDGGHGHEARHRHARGSCGDALAAAATRDEDPLEMLGLDEALTKLEQVDPRKAEVVMLRFFAGLTVDQTAAAMGVAPRTVDNLWRVARAWLHRELDGDQT